MRAVIWILIVGVVALLAYIRLAPTNPERWHQPVSVESDMDMASGAVRIVPAEEGTLARLNEIALGTPRTEILAGSVDEGRITYVTRSRIFGFPDYTTVEIVDGQLRVFARQRFGKADMGVNRDRIESWLAQL